MRVTVDLFSARTEKEVDLPDRSRGLDLLRSLGLAPDAHLLVRADTPIPLDAPLTDGERLLVLTVVSGGSAPFPNY